MNRSQGFVHRRKKLRRWRIGGTLALLLCLAGGGTYWLIRDALPDGVVAATPLSNFVIIAWLDATHRTALVLYGRGVPLSDVHRFAVIAGERGTVIHDVALGEYMPATMAVDERSGHVLVTYMDSDSATLVDNRSGRIIRSLRLPFHPFGTLFNPDTGNAVVSARAANRYLAAILDLQTGSVRRTIALQAQGPAYGAGPPTLDATAHRILITSPGGVNVLEARSLRLIRFTPIATGDTDKVIVDSQTHRAYVTLVNSPAPPCLATNRVCGRSIGAYVVIDARTGRLLHPRVMIPGTGAIGAIGLSERQQRPFVSDYMIYGNRRDNQVYVVDARTGRPLAPIRTSGHATTIAVDDKSNLMVAGSQGGIDAADTRAGTLLNHIPLPVDRIWGIDEKGNYVVSTADAAAPDKPGFFDRVRAFLNTAGASIGVNVRSNSSVDIVHIDARQRR